MKMNAKPAIQPRYVTLNEWAEKMFSKVPHVNTLRRWVHDGHIRPKPRKVGKSWQVTRDAEYVE